MAGTATSPPVRARRETLATVAAVAAFWAVLVRTALPVLWAASLAGAAMGVGAVWLRNRHPGGFPTGGPWWLGVPVAAVHLAVSYVAVPVAAGVVPLLGEQADALVFDAVEGVPTVVVALIAGFVIAPLEELFWRGAVQPIFGHGWSGTKRIGVTTALFVVFHAATLQLPLMGAALLGGVAWGWLRERTGGLAAPIVAHAIWTMVMVFAPPG